MDRIIFSGAYLRYADLRFKDEAGVFARLHITAEMTDEVIEALEWEQPPDCAEMIKLTGGLNGRLITLVPRQKELQKNVLKIRCSEISDFQYVKSEATDKRAEKSELRFIARSNERGAIAKIEEYLLVAGQAPGDMEVMVETQEKLDLAQPEVAASAAAGPVSINRKKKDSVVVQ